MKADTGSRIARSLVLALLLLPISLLAACRSGGAKPAADDAATAKDAAADDDAAADEALEDELKVVKKERELAYARIELSVAKLSVEEEARDADNAIRDAEEDLSLARNEREEHEKLDLEKSLARSALSLDRGKWSREMSAQELGELQAMYEAEEFAQLTKELVLMRGQKGLEFTERDLALDEKDATQLREYELPRKGKELARKVSKAERALADARSKKAKGDIERELKLLRATHAVDEAERELAKERKAAEKRKSKRDKEKAEKTAAATEPKT